jgi:hypothetical protein
MQLADHGSIGLVWAGPDVVDDIIHLWTMETVRYAFEQ